YEKIMKEGVDAVYGARPMKRYIQRQIETLIARRMIEEGSSKDKNIYVDVKDEAYIVTIK
ncbi:MAG: hypothetical protein K2L08_00405, partial [Erysipelotrichaceae bacterium]|nr:hypothetical protein [Erysipelotrichaceae bacterium]